jgi:hypothetical protein
MHCRGRLGFPEPRWLRRLAAIQALLYLGGCAALSNTAASRFADGLSAALLDEDDPALVRDGAPAYLILLDTLIKGDPDNLRYLGAATRLYAAYGVAFVSDPQRAATLTARAREYGVRAVCAADAESCGLDEIDYSGFAATVDRLDRSDADALYSYCLGSLAFIRTHSQDWAAIASLPKVEYALHRLLSGEGDPNAANINMYLGILNTLRPAALGGKPEEGKAYFERAIELSGGRDLSAKVEYARNYARLVYDRPLHDRLLGEVLQSPARQEGLTLFNTLAQQEARELLATADDYF